ncbi:ribonuclease H-like domain-containing protein [Patescibacteria group bacterium]|jgi:DEAD/DEAH box helicase domain-containing protein|nr:ribonuclease H-like domain-containing protein [Patescibacteria group bacterium]
MRYIVFDIETQNIFDDVARRDPTLLSISVASAYDSETDTYHTVAIDELSTLWPVFEKADALVGYNSNYFDIPLLNKYYPGDLTSIPSIDILDSIKNSFGKRIRLDDVASATLGKKKSGHGLQAVEWWKKGEVEKIKKYCQMDVQVTKEIFEYAKKNGHVKYKEGLKVREIAIDTSTWEDKNDSALTFALPF